MTVIAKRFPGSIEVPTVSAAIPLPGSLVIPPGVYTYGGETLNMTVEGAYNLWNVAVDRQNKIVYGSDIATLVTSLSWLTAIGTDDDGRTVADNINNATYFKPHLLCTPTVKLVREILTQQGVTSRIVHCLTGETPTNYYDGHVMIEVMIDGLWVLFDPASGHDFFGNSLHPAVPLLPGVLTRTTPKSIAPERIASSGFDPEVWVESTLTAPGDHESEWMRVLQIPGIERPDQPGHVDFYVSPEFADRAAWVDGLAPEYHVMTDEAAWIAAYYP